MDRACSNSSLFIGPGSSISAAAAIPIASVSSTPRFLCLAFVSALILLSVLSFSTSDDLSLSESTIDFASSICVSLCSVFIKISEFPKLSFSISRSSHNGSQYLSITTLSFSNLCCNPRDIKEYLTTPYSLILLICS